MRGATTRGFTLVELMIVVALVGVLAVLAVHGVRTYLTHSKTAEARNTIGRIAQDAVTSYEESDQLTTAVLKEKQKAKVKRAFCPDSSVNVPNSPPKAGKYQSTKADWNKAKDVSKNKGFPCLKFEMTEPQYYSYSYGGVTTGNAAVFTAVARGDLDGDAAYSTFFLKGGVVDDRPTVAPAIGEVSPSE